MRRIAADDRRTPDARQRGASTSTSRRSSTPRAPPAAQGRDAHAPQHRPAADVDHRLPRNTADDIILSVLPLSFDYGLYQVLMAFKVGATLVLERSFTYPHAVLERLVREKVTGFPIVPTIAAILLQLDLAKYDFSGCATSPTPPPRSPGRPHRAAAAAVPDTCRSISMYGLTECKRVLVPAARPDRQAPGSVGAAMPNDEV